MSTKKKSKSAYTAAQRRTLREALKAVRFANDVDAQTADKAAALAFRELISRTPNVERLFNSFRDFHNASVSWIMGENFTAHGLEQELKK
jgi:hypothetical protein